MYWISNHLSLYLLRYEVEKSDNHHKSGSDLTLDTTRHNAIINQQNLTLKLITNKLNLAYNGQDVELIDNCKTTTDVIRCPEQTLNTCIPYPTADDSDVDSEGSGSGSGSGFGPDDSDYKEPHFNGPTDDIYFKPSTSRTPYLGGEDETTDQKSKNWSKSPKPNSPFTTKDSSFKSTLSVSLILWTLLMNSSVLYLRRRL